MNHPLLGTWKCIRVEHQLEDGSVTYPFGQHPSGYLTYTPEGIMMGQIAKECRSLFSTSGLFEGSESEKASAMDSFISYAGTYSISGGEVTHHVTVSLFPNWVGTDQKREFTIRDNRLILKTATFVNGGKAQKAIIEWERI